MNRKIARGNSGMTLIELTIVGALLSIFSIFMVNIVMLTQTAWSVENTAVPVRTEGKRTLESIAKELREGDPSAPGGVVIGGSGNSQTITFSVPNQVSKTAILSYRQIQFAHDSAQSQVTRTANSATSTVGRNINSLQFSQANNVVTVTIGTTKISAEGRTLQTTVSTQIRLRN